MEPMTMALIASAVLGANKAKEQQDAFKTQQGVEAVKQKWAPFTGQRGQSSSRPSATDPIVQALLTGAMMGQQFKGKGAVPGDGGSSQVGDASGLGAAGTPMAGAAPFSGNGLAAGQSPNFDAYAQQNWFQPYTKQGAS